LERVDFPSVADMAVTLARVAPRATAVVAQTTTWEEFRTLWPRLLDEVYAYVRTDGELAVEHDGAPRWQNVMLYKDDRPAVEVGVLASRSFATHGRVIASQLPGGSTATAIHRGDYAQLGRTHGAIVRYISEHGLERAGPRWEIYGHHDDAREPETEIHYLLRWS
jgi:effector-binding domain-containing protein